MSNIVNEKGHKVVILPISGLEVELRSPKGRDLKQVEVQSTGDNASNIGAAMFLASTLSVQPLTIEDIEEMDAEDFLALSEAVSTFRAFRNLKT